MSDWRNTVITSLAANPEEWRPLGEIYSAVVDAIPMHKALRSAATKQRRAVARRGDTEDPIIKSTDLDLHSAQWSYFTHFTLPLVERKNRGSHSKHSEMVRLKSTTSCETCGNPTYLASWNGRARGHKYTCPVCEIRAEAEVPVVEAEPEVKVEVKTEVKPEPAPEPPFKPLHELTSIKETWNAYVRAAQNPIPEFQQNPKLRRQLHRALEAGMFYQHKRVYGVPLGTVMPELHFIKGLQPFIMGKAMDVFADSWVTKTYPEHIRRKHGHFLKEAYFVGALTIMMLYVNNKLGVIIGDIDRLRRQLEPQAKQPRPAKQRWAASVRAATRNVISRWRVS